MYNKLIHHDDWQREFSMPTRLVHKGPDPIFGSHVAYRAITAKYAGVSLSVMFEYGKILWFSVYFSNKNKKKIAFIRKIVDKIRQKEICHRIKYFTNLADVNISNLFS